MWLELFLCLLLAHLIADFVLQTSETCKSKREKKWHSGYHYCHAAIVFALSWLASFSLGFWWCALVIGVSHFAIDIWKSYCKDNVTWFVVDQLLHLIVLAGVAWFWCLMNGWCMPFEISLKYVALAIAVIACWKPANIFIKLMLKHYSVNMPEEKASGFKAGALIGEIERWLILAFVIMQRYEALGLLIAAKSIIRFGDKETAKTEYVLAGTLMSIFIAVMSGLMVTMVNAC
jgi:hypothetical protein